MAYSSVLGMIWLHLNLILIKRFNMQFTDSTNSFSVPSNMW